MNMSSTHQAKKKKHAGRPGTVTSQTPTAHIIALIRSSAIGAASALGFALLFLFLASFLIRDITDPVTLTFPIAISILCLSAVLCGIVTVRLNNHQPLLCGITAGSTLLLLCAVIRCLLSPTGETHSMNSIISQISIPLLSVIGAMVGHKRPQARSRRRRT